MDEINILLIEDNEGDIILTLEAFKQVGVKSNVEVLNDGEIALQQFRKIRDAKIAIKPDLILLDINLPKINGIELLKIIKSDVDLVNIPVIVLTTSNSHQDIKDAYLNHANSYMVKPMDLFVFNKQLKTLCEYWFKVIKLQVEVV